VTERTDPDLVDSEPRTPNIRASTVDDWQLLRTLRCSMLTNDERAYDADREETVAQPRLYWELWAGGGGAGQQHTVQFAELGRDTVGMAAGHLDAAGQVAHVGAMWVDPHARRNGIGRALLDALETWAHDVEAARVELGVAEWNLPACQLYTSLHYLDTGRWTETRWGHRELIWSKPVEH
jgi:GNAT superfamily N-acetyltransferase